MSKIIIGAVSGKKSAIKTCPIHVVTPETFEQKRRELTKVQNKWLDINGFVGGHQSLALVQSEAGELNCVLFGVQPPNDKDEASLVWGKLATQLPQGIYRIASGINDETQAALAWALSAYDFTRYSGKPKPWPQLAVSKNVDRKEIQLITEGVNLVRDLINTPANDMGPQQLEEAIRKLAKNYKAQVSVIRGNNLLKKNFPMIHAVGRASDQAPRLVDMTWGSPKAPMVTLVGKGVCFDTGGLNIKPGNSMSLMKKDMGGAANTLGLASMIMAAKLPVRLRVLVPAVENNISANAFRPGDVLESRKGLSVEIGNTDAEGRLVLGDALTLADEESPNLLIDMATLTGAARVALGPDLAPYYCDDDELAMQIADAAKLTADPVWRMPFWNRYDEWLRSDIADVNHISSHAFAGSVTAALFLRKFVENSTSYVHFDVFGWAPATLPGVPKGGAAHGIRALYEVIKGRYSKK